MKISNLFNAFKRGISVSSLLLVSAIDSSAQNPYWVFPPNSVNMQTGAVSALPSPALSNVVGSSYSANAVYDADGSIRFYCTEGKIKDKAGNTLYTHKFIYETCIIPIPNAPNDYYILSYDFITGGGFYPCTGYIFYAKYTYNPTTGVLSYVNNSEQQLQNVCDDLIGMAYHPDRGLVIAGQMYTTYYDDYDVAHTATVPMERLYWVSSTGIVNSGQNTRGDWYEAVIAGPNVYPTASTSFATQELEISPNARFSAWGSYNSGTIYLTGYYFTAFDAPYPTVVINVPGTTGITGLEFSADSKKLFFTKKSGGIGCIDLSTGKVDQATLTSISVSGATDLGNSQLELAMDGLIYGSNGTQLKGFDPSAASPSIIKTITVTNPLSTTGGIYTLPDQIDGSYGALNTLSFDGVNDYVEVPAYSAVNNIGTGDFTIEARFKANTTQNVTYPTLFSNRTSTGANGIILFMNGGIPWVNIQNTNYPCSNCPALLDNQVHKLAASRTNGQLSFYVDGNYMMSRPILAGADNISSTANVRIGHDIGNSSNCYFKGEISEVRVWGLARQASDISAYANKSIAGNSSGLVGYWRLNEGAGQKGFSLHNTTVNHGRLGSTDGVDANDPIWVLSNTSIPKKVGSSFERPVVMNSGAAYYQSTLNNMPNNGLDNDLGQQVDDIVYSFTLTAASLVTIQTCNSQVTDTYLTLYNGDRAYVEYNDDRGFGGRICAAGQANDYYASIKMNLNPGQYYVVVEGYDQTYIGNITTTVNIDPFNSAYGVARGRKESLTSGTQVAEDAKALDADLNRPYPNPVKDGLLYFGGQAGEYVLIDGKGLEVMKGHNADRINVGQVTPGVYILKTDGKAEKIIVE